MPIFALAFGSLGDFVTVLQLAWNLRTQLNDAAGASAQIRELVEDIDIFRRAVLQVQETVLRRANELLPDVVNGIAHALAKIKDVLAAADRRMRAHQAKITRAEGDAAWRRLWQIAAWSFLGGNKEVATLRMRLRDHVTAMQTFLSLSQSHDQAAVLQRLDDQRTTLDSLSGLVNAIHAHFGVDTPTFHFRDKYTGEFYQPCARTSIQRLRDLFGATGVAHGIDSDEARLLFSKGEPRLEEGQAKSFQHTLGMRWPYETHMPALDCFFFRSDFGEWQVLVGVAAYAKGGVKLKVQYHNKIQHILKLLLERKHPPSTSCNCDGLPCQTRFQDRLYTAANMAEALKKYDTAATLMLQCFGEKARRRMKSLTTDRIERLLSQIHQPSVIDSDLLPILREYAAVDTDSLIGYQWYHVSNILHGNHPIQPGIWLNIDRKPGKMRRIEFNCFSHALEALL